jgi:hypothetical protein
MPAIAGVTLKLKPVIIFPSLRNRLQRKLMPAKAGVMLELKPEIMGCAAAKRPGKAKRRF